MPPTLERVGVFVNEEPEHLRAIVESAGMTAVQLHGDESSAYVRALFPAAGKRVFVIKAIRMDDRAEESVLAFAAVSGLVDAFLLDSASDLRGGSGKTFDWEAAAALMQRFPKLRFIVAGGLRPDNVQEALRKLRPWGVECTRVTEKTRPPCSSCSGCPSSNTTPSPGLSGKSAIVIKFVEESPSEKRASISTSTPRDVISIM